MNVVCEHTVREYISRNSDLNYWNVSASHEDVAIRDLRADLTSHSIE